MSELSASELVAIQKRCDDYKGSHDWSINTIRKLLAEIKRLEESWI